MRALPSAIVRKALRKRAGAATRRQPRRQSALSASWFRTPVRAGLRPRAWYAQRFCCVAGASGAVFPFSDRAGLVSEPGCGQRNPPGRYTLDVCARGNAASRALRSSKEAMRPKKTILCVDDNEQGLAVRKFLLETRGYRVVTATCAHDAIELLRNGGIDLVLGDLIMPRMDGNEMVNRMKEIAPDVPMMLLSGTVKAFDRACHADAFLPKGACSPVELLERIRVMIARKRGPKKALARPAFEGAYDAGYAGAAHPAVAS